MLISVQDLNFFVGKTHILRSVSLEAAEGEIVGILGRNGAGKSSIIKSIMGLYSPKSGAIRFKDQEVTGLSTRKRVLMGLAYSPEDARIFPELTVEENVRLGMWVTEKDRVENPFNLQEGFDIFPRVKNLWERKGGTLSGGEKKMVSVTRALALRPTLLLLDESFEGLAPLVVRAFSEAMHRIRDMGISIMMAESNLGNASKVISRAYVVDRGEVLFEGHPDEIAKDRKLSTILGR